MRIADMCLRSAKTKRIIMHLDGSMMYNGGIAELHLNAPSSPPLNQGFSSYAIMLLFRAIHSYADLCILMISYDCL